jgi:hypothetical protein
LTLTPWIEAGHKSDAEIKSQLLCQVRNKDSLVTSVRSVVINIMFVENGDLYSWGRGAAVLGHGDQFKLNQSSPPSVIEGVHTKQVLHIGLSADTCAVLVCKSSSKNRTLNKFLTHIATF